MAQVTQLLLQIKRGDSSAALELLPVVYEELRKLAAARLAQEKPGDTLQATALVHEAYIRLVDGDQAQHWDSRGHFFGAAAEAMRRILVDNAVRKKARKRGGDFDRIELTSELAATTENVDRILDIDEALSKLAADEPQAARLVELHYFAGCSVTEAAEMIGISRSNAYRQWAYARAALQCLLAERE